MVCTLPFTRHPGRRRAVLPAALAVGKDFKLQVPVGHGHMHGPLRLHSGYYLLRVYYDQADSLRIPPGATGLISNPLSFIRLRTRSNPTFKPCSTTTLKLKINYQLTAGGHHGWP